MSTPVPVLDSEGLTEKLLEELKRHQDYARIGRKHGVSQRLVRQVDILIGGRFQASPDGLGRPELRKYAIAARHVDEPWDNGDPTIVAARAAYDRGEIELAQGRDGFTIFLYAFPRRTPDRRPDRVYFARQFGD